MDAMISGRGGLALVVEGDRLASIHAGEPQSTIPRHRNEVHFLLGEAQDFVAIENASREEVVRQLMLARDREEALQLALILLDPDLQSDIRQEAAGELEELFAQEDLVVYVESVLYGKPLPGSSDLAGALALAGGVATRKVATMLGKLEASQAVIADVRRAWGAIPPESFGGEAQHWQFVAVREGFFRQLVLDRTAGKNANAFFVDASMRPAVRALPTSRAVLQAWIGPFLEHYQAHEDWARQSKQPQVVREDRRDYKRRHKRHRKRKSVDRVAALEKVNRQKQAIKRAMERRDWERVRKYLEELVEFQLTNGGPEYAAKSLCDLAMAAKELGRTDLQLDWTKRSIRLQEEDGWAWVQYGDALLQLSRFDDAIQAFDQAAKLGQSLVAMNGRAEVLKALGRLDEALTAYDDVRQQHPLNVVAMTGRASTLALAGRLQDALAALPDQEPTTLDDWVGLHVRGMILLRLGKIEDAIDIFNKGAYSDPRPASRSYFKTALAVARLQQKDAEGAAELLTEVDSPNLQIPANVIRVHAFGAVDKVDRAASAFRKLPKVLPFVGQELKRELHRRFVARSGQRHDDDWLYEQEWRLLAAA